MMNAHDRKLAIEASGGEPFAWWQKPGLVWPEARVLREPVKNKDLKEPILLVERNRGRSVISPHGDEFVSLPGMPAISLFTGCGGMDIGMEDAGFVTLIQHEWSPDACETLICNRPNYFRYAALIQGDIRKTPTEMILQHAGLRVGQAELVCGGPPCQGFTTANSNACRGKYDSRNDLVFEYLRVVRESQPAYFVFENVPGFQSFNKGQHAIAFLKAAFESYYEMVYGLLDACNYGVPQRRCRFFCMGTRRDIALIEGRLAGLPRPQNFSTEDLKFIQDASGKPLLTETQKKYLRSPGIRYFPDRPFLVAPAPNNKDRMSKSYLDFYDRLEREEPDRLVQQQEVA